MKPTIIIGLPQSFGMHHSFIKNLNHYGFNTIDISYKEHDFKYKNIGQRIENLLRKVFLSDKNFKNKLKFESFNQEISAKLNTLISKSDYALLIRSDIYPKEIIELVRAKSNFMVGYQWDGLHRFPGIYPLINYFDKFYVFDKLDLNNTSYTFYPITNFYFDYTKINLNENTIYDLFFLGSLIEERMPEILALNKKCIDLNLKPFINLYTSDKNKAAKYSSKKGIKIISEHMSYDDNLKNVAQSTILLDFLNPIHKGLSFRTFEALHYQKKLISNNSTLNEYDFYHPNNIFIWNGKNIDQLNHFIVQPYVEIDPKIVARYSFENWINYILDIKPFNPIDLPS